MTRDSLRSFWAPFVDTAPYVHPADLPVIERSRKHREWLKTAGQESFDTIVRRSDLGMGQKRFWFSLLPVPYTGDLARADIFIVLLNPGFGGAFDFHVEYRRAEWRDRLLLNLRQDLSGLEFPNLNLDPELCWTGSYQWWEGKLGKVAAVLADAPGGYRDAMRRLSQRVACIELVPYHSSEFSGHDLLDELPSTGMARRYVREVLLPEAQADRISLIVTRQGEALGFRPGDRDRGLIVYGGGHRRGAHLGPETDGGREILDRIRRHPRA